MIDIVGCSFDQWMVDPTLYTSVFIATVVKSLGSDQIGAENILNVTPGFTSPTLAAAARHISLSLRSLQSSSKSALTVSCLISKQGAIGVSTEGVLSTLKMSVASGIFTTNLNTFGLLMGAPGLVKSTADKAPITVESTNSGGTNNNKSKGLSTGTLVGIIVGILAFLGLMFGGYYLYSNAKKTKHTTNDSKEPSAMQDQHNVTKAPSATTVNPIFSNNNTDTIPAHSRPVDSASKSFNDL